MSRATEKLSALRSARQKLGVNDNRSSGVRSRVSNIVTALDEYIRNDNFYPDDAIRGKLQIQIEEHPDFGTAVSYLDTAIRAAEEEVRQEEAAIRAAQEASRRAAAARQAEAANRAAEEAARREKESQSQSLQALLKKWLGGL